MSRKRWGGTIRYYFSRLLGSRRRLTMGGGEAVWDPPVLALIAVAAGLVYGIWRLLSSAPLPGKLRRWGQLQLPAGECGLTFAQSEEASRDFTRTFGPSQPQPPEPQPCPPHVHPTPLWP